MAVLRNTISSRDLDRDLAGAKRMAEEGPVVVTDEGRPAFVLMTHDAFEAMGKRKLTLLDTLSDPRPEADFEFEFERIHYPESEFVDFDVER